MANKYVYLQDFGIVEVPAELQGDALIRYANQEADRIIAASSQPAAEAPVEKTSPGILSQTGAFVGSIPEGIAKGVGSTISGIGALTTIDALKRAGAATSEFGEDISKYLMDEELRQSMGAAGGRLVGNIATYLTPGIAAKALGLAPRAALALSSAVSGAAGAGEQLEKIEQARAGGKEISPAQEFGLTALAGAGTAALESLPLGRMLGSPVVEKIPLIGKIFKEAGLDPNLVRQIEQKYAGAGDAAEGIAEDLSIAEFNRRANLGLGGILKSSLQSGAIEAPVEGLQNTLQNVISKYAYDPEQEITEGLKESLIAGGLAGSAIQGGIEIYQSKQAKATLDRKRAEAKRISTESPIAPETASQETLFIDPATGQMKIVGRETEEQKKIKEIAKDITSGASLPTALPAATEKTVSTRIGDIRVPASLTPEEIEQQVSEIEALRAYSEESARDSQLAYEQGEKAKRDLAEAKKFISQYRSVANEILPEVGVDSIKDLYGTPADVPVFVDLMIDRIYKNQEQLDSANKNIESNLGIASDLSRSVFKENISKLTAPQRIELSGLVDLQFEADIAEYESAKEEAGIRTAMNVEGSSKEPVYVRQKRLAVELFGKPYEGLNTSERNEVNAKAKRRIEGLEVSTNEVVEKRQFEGKPFTTADYRRVLEGLKSDPEKSITTSRIIEDFGIPPPAAPSMVSLMRQRGDAVKVGSKILVDESARGPMYEITEDTEPPTTKAPSGEALFQAAQTSATQPQFDEQLARQYAPDLVDALKKRKMDDLFLLGISNALLDAEGNVQPANGAYLNRVIYLATSPTSKVRTKEEMISTLDHEIIHGMKELGMFSANEWRMLTEKFTPSIYLGDREKVYRERYKGRTNLEDLIKEEAVARAASNLAGADPKRLDPAAKSLVRKVESFLGFGRTAAQMGYASAEDVLSAIKSGEIGGRRFTPIYEAGRGGTEIYAPREIQIKAGQKVPGFTPPAPKVAEPAKVKPAKGGKAKKVKPKSVDEAVYSYIGESAYSDDPIESASIASSKESALGMEKDGYSPEKIRLATGWFRGPYDNEWRREVADDLARVTDAFRDLPETMLFAGFGKKNEIPLSLALNHPELFKAYPDLNSVKVIRQKGVMDFGGLQGWFDPDKNTINITPYAKDPESTLLHEVQHWIQEKEGFATGGNQDVAIEMANPDLIESALGRVLEKKKNDIGKIGKEIEDWSVAEKIRGSDGELAEKFKDLSKKSDERFREFAKAKDEDPNKSELKERWVEVYTEREDAMDSLLSIIRSQFKDANPYSVLAKLSADPSGRQYDERRLIETQKEIAQIQSGDMGAIFKILKTSDESFNLYRNIAGEIEARDVQARKPLTAKERELEEPFSSEKVERTQSIVIKGKRGKGQQSDIMYSLADKENDINLLRQILKENQVTDQSKTSKDTSRNQVAEVFKKIDWKDGSTNFDYGGGKFDRATDYLKENGVRNILYDPFSRTEEHNLRAVESLAKGQADSGTMANVLNVIPERKHQLRALEGLKAGVKPGAAVYIGVYEGDGSGEGRVTSDGFQHNKKTKDYFDTVKQVFPDARIKQRMIVASKPISALAKAQTPPKETLTRSESSDIMYSLDGKEDSDSSTPQVTPGGIVRAFSPPAKKSIVDSIYDFFSVDRQSSFRQKFLDRYDPIKEWAIKAYEKTQDPKYLAAASGAYQALLFSDKAQDVAMAFLEMGGLSYNGKIFTAKENEKTAPIKIFGRLANMPASQLGFNNKLEEFFEASYARRYLDLVDKQGKDPGGVVNLDDVRRTWDTFSGDTDITDAMGDFKAFNDNLIDIFVKSGFIDRQMGESWKQAYYIPFYRLPTKRTADGDMETGEVDAPRVSSKATNLAAYKALSGRNLRVNDAIENVIYNTYFMVGTAMKNVAAQRVVRDGLVTGYMKELKVDPDTKRREREEQGTNVISIRDKGVKKFYQVNDPMVYDAVAKSNIPVQDALKMMGGFTKLLRKGVTLGPTFILRNPIRDTLQVWMQGGIGSNLTPPIGEYIKGITAVLQDSPEYRALKAAGISGSGIRQENIKDTATAIRQKIGTEQKNIVNKFLGVLENASEKSEGISRVQAYKNALNKTGDEAEALFAAMETINFSRRGTSRGAQIAIALLPFFNARLQGLDVFYRTLKGDRMVPKELSPNGRRDAVTRMAYVASLSMLYAALMAGNKAWQNASEEERDANIFIPIDWIEGVKEGTVLKFPIPQELGIFTKMLPERLISWYLKQEDGTDLVNAMARAMLETLSMDPLPQMIRPMYENVSNFDFYTMKPIENRYLQNLLPEERYTEYTSEAYKKVGQALGVSPVKLDHLIRGYTGTIGALTADAAGMLLELGKENAKPERMRFSEPNLLPGIGQLFRGPNGKRAVEELYQLDEAANMAVATLRAVSKGQREMSPESQEELRSMLYIDKAISPTLKRVQALNRMKRTILAADDMSPKEKRDELNAIDEEIVSISSELKDLRSELPARFRVGLAKHFGF